MLQNYLNVFIRDLALRCRKLRDGRESARLPACILSGGEPVVQVAKTDKPRRGGRNQQLVLAGLESLMRCGMAGIVLLSGGKVRASGTPEELRTSTDHVVQDFLHPKLEETVDG